MSTIKKRATVMIDEIIIGGCSTNDVIASCTTNKRCISKNTSPPRYAP